MRDCLADEIFVLAACILEKGQNVTGLVRLGKSGCIVSEVGGLRIFFGGALGRSLLKEILGKGSHVNVLLGKGNLDARFLESIPNGQQDFTPYIAYAVGGILDPKAQL